MSLAESISLQEVARKAKRILPLMGRVMESQMRVPSIPMPPVHFHVLNRIYRQPQTLTDLAQGMHLTAASLSRTISVLEERGWVTRSRSEDDRRISFLKITPEGQAVLVGIEERSEAFLVQSLSRLSQEDLAKLMEGLDILIGAFSQQMSHLPSDSKEQSLD
jgi:DNA-binding MarR family transcriptional regulator